MDTLEVPKSLIDELNQALEKYIFTAVVPHATKTIITSEIDYILMKYNIFDVSSLVRINGSNGTISFSQNQKNIYLIPSK